METTNISGAQKLTLQALSLLFGLSCLLFIAYLISLSSYNIEKEQKEEGWGGKVFVGIKVCDKITKGKLGTGFCCDTFVLNLNNQKKVRDKNDIGSAASMGDALFTQENIDVLRDKALSNYKGGCKGGLVLTGILSIILWVGKKTIRKKFNQKPD